MGPATFWQRLSAVFRTGESPRGGDAPVALRPTNGDGAGRTFWWPRSRRASRLTEVSQRVGALADALQAHFDRQDAHAAQLTRALDRVGAVLEQLAETQRAQGECLRAIAAQTEAGSRGVNSLAEAIQRIPDSLKAQADAVRTVARQVELSQESATQLLHAVHNFGRAVDTLGTAGQVQVEALQRLHNAQREEHGAVTELMRTQGRRLLLVSAVGAVLVVAALGTLAIVLLTQFR